MITSAGLRRTTPLTTVLRRLGGHITRRLPATSGERLLDRLWWPFVAASGLAALQAHGTNRAYPAYVSDRDGTDLYVLLSAVRRRLSIQQGLMVGARALWLALLITLVLMLARYLVAVPWAVIGLGVLLVAVLAWAYHRTHPVTIWTTARVLDRHYRLGEQLATALELSAAPSKSRMGLQQIGRALATTKDLRATHSFRPRLPWAEIHVAASLALLVIGIGLMGGTAERLVVPRNLLAPVDTTPAALTEFGDATLTEIDGLGQTAAVPPDEYLAAVPSTEAGMDLSGSDLEALREAAERSNRSVQELQQIAEALKDASVTSQAAKEIQAGNYEGAAAEIAQLAKSLEALSPEARANLAENLKQASQNVEPIDPELARRLAEASKAVASRSDKAAAQGLEDISKAISEAGKNVISQAELAQALDQLGEGGAGMNDDGPTPGQSSASGGEGNEGALGEGEAGQFGFGAAESALGIGVSGATGMTEDGSGGGAGQGSGNAEEQYTPSLNPNSQRVDVATDQGTGPTAPRLGQPKPGAPDVITTGPGTTGPGNAPQGNLPISIGQDANRVPRGLRSVVEGYFKDTRAQTK
jgi:hypothetical protein